MSTSWENESIFSAAVAGKIEAVRLIIQQSRQNPVVNSVEAESGFSMLHFACIMGHADISELLLDNGAEIDLRDKTNETPLMKAITNLHLNAAALLITKGANVKVKDDFGRTCLHIAAGKGSLTLVEMLLEAGSVVDSKCGKGRTALMFAAAGGHFEVVEFLLKNGANPTIRDGRGFSAYELAALIEDADICEILEECEVMQVLRNMSRISEESSQKEFYKTCLQSFEQFGFQDSLYFVEKIAGKLQKQRIMMEFVYENQRGSLFGKYSASNLNVSDVCGPWSDKFGVTKMQSGFHLPDASWEWVCDWKLSGKSRFTDQNGWIYAKSFETSSTIDKKKEYGKIFSRPRVHWQNAPNGKIHNGVRRRKWIRIRHLKRGFDASLAPLADEMVDYLEQAVDLSSHLAGNAEQKILQIEKIISILLAGYKTEKNLERKKMANNMIQENFDLVETLKGLKISSVEPSSKLEISYDDAPPSYQEILDYSSSIPSAPHPILMNIYPNLPVEKAKTIEWVPDDMAHECFDCKKAFSMFLRRHHCRFCGKVFCDFCTANRIRKIEEASDGHRSCNSCFSAMVQEGKIKENEGDGEAKSGIFIGNNPVVESECLVCGRVFDKSITAEERDFHLNECLNSPPTMTGNRYMVHQLDFDLEGKECSICFELFLKGDKVAVLNCLCQYHEKCIDDWFLRGKLCPFHNQ